MSLDARLVMDRSNFRLDIGFEVPTGGTIALLGANGSGKTSALRCLAGLDALDMGSIIIDGATVDDGRRIYIPPEKRPIGMVFQRHALFSHLSVADNIAFGLRTKRGAVDNVDERVADIADRFDLSSLLKRSPNELSGGQAQRVAVARALVTEPRLLLLDEPMAALDVGARAEARRDLDHQLSFFRCTRVLVTHDPLDVYALADRVAVLEDGRITQAGSVAEVTARPKSRFVAGMVGTNLVYGNVSSDGMRTTGGVLLPLLADFVGSAWASIRPQSITLMSADADTDRGSARINLEGTVSELSRLPDRIRVSIEGEVPLVAEITPAAADDLALAVGSSCRALIKATDVNVYPA